MSAGAGVVSRSWAAVAPEVCVPGEAGSCSGCVVEGVWLDWVAAAGGCCACGGRAVEDCDGCAGAGVAEGALVLGPETAGGRGVSKNSHRGGSTRGCSVLHVGYST